MEDINDKQQEIEANLKKAEIQIDKDKLNEFLEEKKLEQNFSGAILGGALAAIVGAVIWAIITYTTKLQIGWMAVGIGFLVGYSVRFLGKGLDEKFGYVGAIFSLLGCLLGNLFAVIIFTSNEFNETFFSLLFSLNLSIIVEIFKETFSIMDLLFYGLAIYEGYKISFRTLNENEVSNLSKETTLPL